MRKELEKILWILHHPWETIEGQREYHLIKRLAPEFNIFVLTWSYNKKRSRWNFLNPFYYFKILRYFEKESQGVTLVHFPVLPNIVNFLAKEKMQSFFLNRWSYRFFVKKTMKKHGIKKVIVTINQWQFGLLPKMKETKVLFDYLDAYSDRYLPPILSQMNKVLVVSHYLQRQLASLHSDVEYSPNGIDMSRFEDLMNVDEAKKKLGLQGKLVVSLIGLTCSPQFYFVEALALLKRENLIFMFVGSGDTQKKLIETCERLGVNYLAPGWVSQADIQLYYSATDIGLYPGEINAMYDGACPLKVLEYSASRKPIVSSPSWELEHLNFPNLCISAIDPQSFSQSIEKMIGYSGNFPDLSDFDWNKIANEFSMSLQKL